MKLAALVAVGIAPYDPIIDRDCAAWATDLVVRDVKNIIDRFDRGDVGSGTWRERTTASERRCSRSLRLDQSRREHVRQIRHAFGNAQRRRYPMDRR
jgi:hypothetical protein